MSSALCRQLVSLHISQSRNPGPRTDTRTPAPAHLPAFRCGGACSFPTGVPAPVLPTFERLTWPSVRACRNEHSKGTASPLLPPSSRAGLVMEPCAELHMGMQPLWWLSARDGGGFLRACLTYGTLECLDEFCPRAFPSTAALSSSGSQEGKAARNEKAFLCPAWFSTGYPRSLLCNIRPLFPSPASPFPSASLLSIPSDCHLTARCSSTPRTPMFPRALPSSALPSRHTCGSPQAEIFPSDKHSLKLLLISSF